MLGERWGVSIAMPAQERTSADRWALGGNQFLVPDVEGGFLPRVIGLDVR